jgi:hypothetical protein
MSFCSTNRPLTDPLLTVEKTLTKSSELSLLDAYAFKGLLLDRIS